MAKKSKDEVPNPNSITNRDILQRLNFLYQASLYVNTLSNPLSTPTPAHTSITGTSAPATSTETEENSRKNKNRRRVITSNDLARSYISTMKLVGKRTTVKMDPTIKRTLCKGCNTILVPGSTATVRIKKSSSHRHAMILTCNECGTFRRIPAPPIVESVEDHAATEPSSNRNGASSGAPQVEASTTMPTSSCEAGDVVMGDTGIPATTSDAAASTSSSKCKGKKKSDGTWRRRPPLFARDVGHVIFRGNERLPKPELYHDDGTFVS